MTSLKKCPSGSSRSRVSHRCRKSLASKRSSHKKRVSSHKKRSSPKKKASSHKKRSSLIKRAGPRPCGPEQTRDRETKRCRKSHARKQVPSFKQHQAAIASHSKGKYYAPIHHKVASHSIASGAAHSRSDALASLGARLSSVRNSFLKSLKRGSDGKFSGGAKKRSSKKKASHKKKASRKMKKSSKSKKRSSKGRK